MFDWGWTLWDPENNALMKDAIKILEFAKGRGYKIAIACLASDGDVDRRMRLMGETGVSKYCDSIKISKEMDKNILLDGLLEEFGVHPEETIVVDDRTIRGVLWAVNNEATAVWFQNGKHSEELPLEGKEPDCTIHSLFELMDKGII